LRQKLGHESGNQPLVPIWFNDRCFVAGQLYARRFRGGEVVIALRVAAFTIEYVGMTNLFDARMAARATRIDGGGDDRWRFHGRHNTRLTQTPDRCIHNAADPYKFQIF